MTTDQSNATTTEKRSLTAQVWSIFQGLISIVAIIYTIGFIIINSYYSRYGIAVYEVPQVKVLSAGVLFIVLHLSLSIFPCYVLLRVFNPLRLYIAIVVVSLSFIGGWTFSLDPEHSVSNALIAAIATGIIVAVSSVAFSVIALPDMPKLPLFGKLERQTAHQNTLLLVILSSILFSAMIFWSIHFWPFVPGVLGGGQTSSAVFVLKESEMGATGMPFLSMQSLNISAQQTILLENSSEYFLVTVIPDRTKSITKLPRSIVLMVVYAPRTGFVGEGQLPTLTPVPGPPLISPTLTVTPTITTTPVPTMAQPTSMTASPTITVTATVSP
jgi:hypothetical protein